MTPIQLFDAASCTYTYVLADEASGQAIIIDPVDTQWARDVALLRERGLRLVWAIETHAHADHVTSAGRLAEEEGARTAAPEGCAIGTAAVQLSDGQELHFGGQTLRCLHTPGHTAGSMSFVWHTGQDVHVFTGDTLLIDGCGRTDFQSGSAQDMYRSLTQVLFALPAQAVVWPGHDYQQRTHSTIGHEALHNARVAGKTLAEFEQTMAQLGLPRPKRLDEAVPANMRSGLMRHDAAEGGVGRGDDMQVRPAAGYAGDISPALAWAWVQAGQAVLVDVRTDAERAWVGFVPGALALPWKQWPGMVLNAGFDADVLAAARQHEGQKWLMLCRSGVRSVAAAQRASALGLQAYNILEGFEGDPDANAQRGQFEGWRWRGLPWRQH